MANHIARHHRAEFAEATLEIADLGNNEDSIHKDTCQNHARLSSRFDLFAVIKTVSV